MIFKWFKMIQNDLKLYKLIFLKLGRKESKVLCIPPKKASIRRQAPLDYHQEAIR